jgi:hypothetical protein
VAVEKTPVLIKGLVEIVDRYRPAVFAFHRLPSCIL